MKLANVSVSGLRGKSFQLAPAHINTLFAKNGSGKSTLQDGIRFGLTGLLPKDAEKVLSPRNDGTKLAACFTCGAPYEAYNGDGDAYNIYTAFDFDVTGLKAVNQ